MAQELEIIGKHAAINVKNNLQIKLAKAQYIEEDEHYKDPIILNPQEYITYVDQKYGEGEPMVGGYIERNGVEHFTLPLPKYQEEEEGVIKMKPNLLGPPVKEMLAHLSFKTVRKIIHIPRITTGYDPKDIENRTGLRHNNDGFYYSWDNKFMAQIGLGESRETLRKICWVRDICFEHKTLSEENVQKQELDEKDYGEYCFFMNKHFRNVNRTAYPQMFKAICKKFNMKFVDGNFHNKEPIKEEEDPMVWSDDHLIDFDRERWEKKKEKWNKSLKERELPRNGTSTERNLTWSKGKKGTTAKGTTSLEIEANYRDMTPEAFTDFINNC